MPSTSLRTVASSHHVGSVNTNSPCWMVHVRVNATRSPPPAPRVYAASGALRIPSLLRLILKRNPVVIIGVGRRAVGRDNGSCRRCLSCVEPRKWAISEIDQVWVEDVHGRDYQDHAQRSLEHRRHGLEPSRKYVGGPDVQGHQRVSLQGREPYGSSKELP